MIPLFRTTYKTKTSCQEATSKTTQTTTKEKATETTKTQTKAKAKAKTASAFCNTSEIPWQMETCAKQKRVFESFMWASMENIEVGNEEKHHGCF